MRSVKLLKRWIDMLTGKSVYHVQQGIGKHYDKNDVKGYYNDMSGKVLGNTVLDEQGIPLVKTITGVVAYFPITIFQYALGLYDLYLETKDDKYKEHFLVISDWACNKINKNGMWNCMETLKDSKHYTQSSMCQSEGASVLLRAYKLTGKKKYYNNAKKAIDFMIEDIKKGGTCSYKNNEVIFQEYVYCDDEDISVLNGWIFSIFGLYDFVLLSDDSKYKTILDKTFNSLAKSLHKYDRKFWSNYDMKKTISSPAYHDIHIRQLRLLYDLTGIEEFNIYSKKWEKYTKNKFYKLIAMLTKLKQKISSNKYYDVNTSTVG